MLLLLLLPFYSNTRDVSAAVCLWLRRYDMQSEHFCLPARIFSQF
jgi:hypothetical protein